MVNWVQQEQELREKIHYVELLGELNIQEEWVADFQQFFSYSYQQARHLNGLSTFIRSYPACLAVYLVMQGVYSYQEGDYWSHIIKHDKHANITRAKLGEFFKQFLQEHHLVAFPEMEGHKYVASILLHGGIPNYSLSDFFEHLLEPALLRPHLYGEDGQEVIANWLETKTHTYVDKPITRFLQLGGKLASDFVERCLSMARSHLEYNIVPPADTLGLPARVTASYSEWVRQRQGSKQTARIRLRKPTIQLDPWGGTLFAEFPEQTLPTTFDTMDCLWKIETGTGDTESIAVASYYNGEHVESEAWQVELTSISHTYHLSFVFAENQRSWYFRGMNASVPCFAFDYETRNLLSLNATLPARALWLLFPQDAALNVDGGSCLEVGVALNGAWEGYQAEAWDLSNARSVQFGAQQILVEPDWSKLQPYLEGERVEGLSQQPGEPTLFVDFIPDILIPLTAQSDPQTEIRRWRIMLRERGQAEFRAISLAECPHALEEQSIRCYLEDYEGWSVKFTHIYDLQLQGPLGRDARFSFVVLQNMAMHVPTHSIRFPDAYGIYAAPQVTMTVGKDVVVESDQSNVTISATQPGTYAIEASSDETKLHLSLYSRYTPKQPRVPLTLVFPMLRWTIVEDGWQTTAIEWKTREIPLSLASLEQMCNPQLLVALFPYESNQQLPRGSLCIHQGQDQPEQELDSKGRTNRRLLFHIGAAIDTIRNSNSGFTRIELHLGNRPENTIGAHIPVITISQSLGLRSIHLEHVLVEDTWLFHISWQGGRNLRKRVMRLWPLWRPWMPASVYALPDELSEEVYEFEASLNEVPVGCYRLEIAVENAWSMEMATRPPLQVGDGIDVLLGEDESRKERLISLPKTVEGTIERLLAIPIEKQAVSWALKDLEHLLKAHSSHHFQVVCEALLVLIEQSGYSGYDQHAFFPIFQEYLQHFPIRLLVHVSQYCRLSDRSRCIQYEELLARLAPQAQLENLLRYVYRQESIPLQELQTCVPELQNNEELQRETIMLLQDAGIVVNNQEMPETPSQMMEEFDRIYNESFFEPALDSVRQYLQDISHFPLLNAEQESALARAIRDGNEAQEMLESQENGSAYLWQRIQRGEHSREKLINHNLRLVVSIARKYGQRRELPDLIQDGNLGLIKACEKFDGDKGYKFSTYATWWIRQAITRGMMDYARTIRLPVHILEDVYVLRRAQNKLLQQSERDPTVEELASEMVMNVEKVQTLLRVSQDIISLDAPLGEDGEATLGATLEAPYSDPQENLTTYSQKTLLEACLNHLQAREQMVLRMRYGFDDSDGHTLEEIGTMLHVTRERVRQLQEKALKKLKVVLRKQQIQGIF